MSFDLEDLKARSERNISPERRLWCAMIRDTFYRATLGEGTSLLFFKTQGGHFTRLCEFLQLPESDIRSKVISSALANRATANTKERSANAND
jgi:hypothetical protein